MISLVEGIRYKDQKSYRKLYDLFSKPMYNVCFRVINNEADAEDVLQEVFIKVFQGIEKLKNPDLLPAWIKRIAINTSIEFIKRRDKIRFGELEDKISDTYFIEEDDINEAELNHEDIIWAISQLAPKYRIVFNMHVVDDCSHEEIAEILGIASSTSRSQYLRARRKVLEIIQQKNVKNVGSIKKIYRNTSVAF
jgi:RNA polymerase sigma factor (sigma-70 family)